MGSIRKKGVLLGIAGKFCVKLGFKDGFIEFCSTEG